MKTREIEEFGAIIADVFSLYGRECPDGVKQLWWSALRAYSIAEVRGALSTHVQNPDGGQFIPKPADVIRILNGSGETRALQAWSKGEDAVRRVGPWESVAFDDPIIHAVLTDMGGWTRFGQTTDEEWPFTRNEFVKRYQGYTARPPTAFPRALAGHVAQHNARLDADTPLPRLVGDPAKATTTYLAGQEITHSYPRLAADLVQKTAARLNAPKPLSTHAAEGDGRG